MAATGCSPIYTAGQITNQCDVAKLDSLNIWEGSDKADFPPHIGDVGKFTHTADQCGGSIGGLMYDVSKCRVVIAWSYKNGVTKAYTQIFPEGESVDWLKIKTGLDNSGQHSSDEKGQISSIIDICSSESNDASATVTAAFNPVPSRGARA